MSMEIDNLARMYVQRFDAAFMTAVKGAITPQQRRILELLKQKPGINQAAVVLFTGIDRSTTANVVHRLVQRGYVRRRRDKNDVRSWVLNLTKTGEDVLHETEEAVASVRRDLQNKLTKAEQIQLKSLMGRVLIFVD